MEDAKFTAAVRQIGDAGLPVTSESLFVAHKGIFDSLDSEDARDLLGTWGPKSKKLTAARTRMGQLLHVDQVEETKGPPTTLASFLSSPAGLPWTAGAEGEPYIFYRDDPSVSKKPRAGLC